MKTNSQSPTTTSDRRGSTLVIVIALLGLLAFTGVVFFTFASSERQAAEYFSDAAKGEVDAPDNVWDHPLRQIISGTSNSPSDRASILRSTTRRHSMTTNLVGGDLSPHSGEGVHLIMQDDPSTPSPALVPRVDMDWDGDADDEPQNQLLLDFVDSPSVWMGDETRSSQKIPAPDVDYTSPDINNLFLAYKGWAVRENGGSYERVPIIIPSFFRPQYMKTGDNNGFSGSNTPTDINWAQTTDFAKRSFRPHPQHIAGFMADGITPVFRYLTAAEATSFGITSGAFPFVPADNALGKPGGMNGYQGELGVWTGSDPEAYELDADPDGDGIREGIWIDTHYPVQEHVDGSGTTRLYVVMHSFTIYDLDGLIDLNVHGNLAGLDRSGNLQAIAGSGVLNSFSVSRSNQGLGPNEINPIWALRRPLGPLLNPADPNYIVDDNLVRDQMVHHFGQLPNSPLEQANMEWMWLLSGRAQINDVPANTLEDIFTGRWGEAERVFNTYRVPGGTFQVWDLPRPGASGNAQQMLSAGIRFGGPMFGNGRNGFDDNQDAMDGEIAPGLGRIRPFGTPIDYAGTGRTIEGYTDGYNMATGRFTFPVGFEDPRIPILHHNIASPGPERFQAFYGYSMTRDINTANSRYVFGQNGTFDNATGDDLIANPNLDSLFEDPLESVFDAEISQKSFDAVFGPQDTPALHLTDADITSAPDTPSERMLKLAPYALDRGNAPFSFYEQVTPGVRSRFTTVSNSLHRFMMRSPFGADGRPGDAGIDDDGDGIIDEPDEVFAASYLDSDTKHRAWEFSADADGNDRDGDGFPDGDGFYEFPPAFGATATTGKPYSGTDPFRPQVRRMLTMESGEGRGLFGQMPLSINHILDVERNNETPADGTPAFLYFMQETGMRFRPLIDHPAASEGAAVIGATAIPTTAPFPPTTPEQREFWARRDRQKLARDIYVLLYTTGGAGQDAGGTTLNYTTDNVPTNAGTGVAELEGITLYTHDQLRRMAQFAVNLIDAMDSDNVMTKFEYDKNLGDGWNLDDDPYTDSLPVGVDKTVNGQGLYPEDDSARGVVWGVEAQELAISETQGIHSAKTTAMDHASTPFPDESTARDFLYVELQNLRPMPLTLGQANSSTADTAIWRLGRYDRDDSAAIVGNAMTPDKQIAIVEHAENVVDGGGRFSISVASDAGLASSAFFVDTGDPVAGTFDGTYELVAPDAADVTLPTTPNNKSSSADPGYVPLTDIDVIHDDHNGVMGAARFDAPSGNFLETLVPYDGNDHFKPGDISIHTFNASGSPFGFDLVLQRRANPNLPQLDDTTANPWVEVDRIRVEFNAFDIKDGDQPVVIFDPTGPSGYLTSLASTERLETLDDTSRRPSQAKAANPYRKNTVKAAAAATKNDMLGVNASSLPDPTLPASMTNPANGFDLTQIHYDREYASSAELLQLPLVGPNLLTHRLNRMRYAPYRQVDDDLIPAILPSTDAFDTKYLSSAEAMFLQPVFPTVPPPLSVEVRTARDNRWYRLFQFVEVPSRVHRMLGNYLTLQRIPGKLNVNMIRHREVLAGLIDNPLFADVWPLGDAPPINNEEDGPFLRSTLKAGDRDVWMDLIKDRDGSPTMSYNPTAVPPAAASFWLPATANAKPFRSYGFQGSNPAQDNGLEHTPLRRLREDFNDGVDTTNRHWLEVGSTDFHKLPGDLDTPPDGSEERRFSAVSQRHQVLSKVLNNTTTVSNCFIAYGVAAYFEAYEEPTTGLIRVGGRYDLDQDGNATNDEQRAVFIIDRTEAFNAYDPGTNDFDWKRLVKNQVIIK